MKKLLSLFVLAICFFLTAQAGYIIRGINSMVKPSDLKNFTLVMDNDGNPIAAASMHSSSGSGTGRNAIILISPMYGAQATYFPFTFLSDGNFNIDVKDIQYESTDPNNPIYVLCGSRETNTYSRAFVAVVAGDFSSMHYVEYSDATVFYSICVGEFEDYYVCGKKDNDGIIASISKTYLQFTNLYKTEGWEYNKIIQLKNPYFTTPIFAASGRNSEHTRIGYIVFYYNFLQVTGHQWAQNTERDSHCVLSEEELEYRIILASSYQNVLTLTPVTIPILPVTAYNFTLGGQYNRFSVWDIGTIEDDNNIRISVTGYTTWAVSPTPPNQAWYGEVAGLSTTSVMQNKNYYDPINIHEHYKIRYYDDETYTGGYFQRNYNMCAIFGTPRTVTQTCDISYPSLSTASTTVDPLILSLTAVVRIAPPHVNNPLSHPFYQLYYDECLLKGGVPASELVMQVEDESEIITFYDYITVKDAKSNTNYQIFSITGQLIQTGTTNPDISTANLSKGFYILRLENGKAYKFVK